jgi:hypothetical protein
VKDKNSDLLEDSYSTLNRWKNYFCQLLNVHSVAEPLVPNHSSFQVEIAIEKLNRNKSPGIDQILAELIQTGGNTLRFEIHKLINSI